MRFRRKRFAIAGGILAAFALTVGVIAGITNKKEDAAAATGSGTVTIGSKIWWNGQYITNHFSLSVNGESLANDGRAWCGYGTSGNKTPGYKNNGGTVNRSIEIINIDENSSDLDKKIFEAMYYGIEAKNQWGQNLSDDYVDLSIHYAIMKLRGKYSGTGFNSGDLLDYMSSIDYALPNKDEMKVYYSIPGDGQGHYNDEQRIYSYSWKDIEYHYIDLTVKKNWQDSLDSTDTRAPIHVKITKSDGSAILDKSGATVDLSDVELSAPTWTRKFYNLQELGDGVTFQIQELTDVGGWSTTGGQLGGSTLMHNDVRKADGYPVNYYIPGTNDLVCSQTGDYSFECTATNVEKENARVRLWTYKHWSDLESENRRSLKYDIRAFVKRGDSYVDVSGTDNGVPDFPKEITKTNTYNTTGSVWGGVYVSVPKTTADAENPENVVYGISEQTLEGYEFECADENGVASDANKITFDGRTFCIAGTKPDGDFEVHWRNTEDTVELTAYKTWNDGGDISKRPIYLFYEIYQDGELYTTKAMRNPAADDSSKVADIWYVKEELPAYKYNPEDGSVTPHTYTYKEVGGWDEWLGRKGELSENYSFDTREHALSPASDNGAANGMINTGKTSIPVQKCWVDNDETKRPKSIRFNLYRKGYHAIRLDYIDLKVDSLDEDSNCWVGSFDDLDAFDSQGNSISYEVEEDTSNLDDFKYYTYVGEDEEVQICEINAGENFAAEDEDKQSCTFYNVELVDIPVKKVWAEDTKEDRPGSIEVSLLCGDNVLDTVTLSEANNLDGDNTWEYTWKNRRVDECEQGYSVAENINIPGYATKITGNAEDGFVITNTKTLDTIVTWGSVGAGSFGALAAGFFVAKRKLFGR